MRSKFLLAVICLFFSYGASLAGSRVEMSGPWPQSSGPHTPYQPDARD
jgi:hypothetical protein